MWNQSDKNPVPDKYLDLLNNEDVESDSNNIFEEVEVNKKEEDVVAGLRNLNLEAQFYLVQPDGSLAPLQGPEPVAGDMDIWIMTLFYFILQLFNFVHRNSDEEGVEQARSEYLRPLSPVVHRGGSPLPHFGVPAPEPVASSSSSGGGQGAIRSLVVRPGRARGRVGRGGRGRGVCARRRMRGSVGRAVSA